MKSFSPLVNRIHMGLFFAGVIAILFTEGDVNNKVQYAVTILLLGAVWLIVLPGLLETWNVRRQAKLRGVSIEEIQRELTGTKNDPPKSE